MTTGVVRKIIHIDEDKCNGCGACVPACVEGALQIVDGKARLISEKYCDGLGACLGECPQGAITIEEKWCEEFDEEAVNSRPAAEAVSYGCPSTAVRQFETPLSEPLPCGCPSASVKQFAAPREAEMAPAAAPARSMLQHWPIQLTLVPPGAPFLQDTDLLLTADCVPFAYAGFHQDLLKGHAVLVACPKLDDFSAHVQKLTQILRHSRVKSLTVVHMEVPCCFGLVHLAREALRLSGSAIPLRELTIGVRGDLEP